MSTEPLGTAMNVGDWLRSLGLGKYEARFRDCEIDSDILRELTESDLEKLGLPLGHRKRLLKAIAGLGAAATAPSTATLRLDADAAERRHLTVMFIDLVGSSALSASSIPRTWGCHRHLSSLLRGANRAQWRFRR
jgi:hypothetical protein